MRLLQFNCSLTGFWYEGGRKGRGSEKGRGFREGLEFFGVGSLSARPKNVVTSDCKICNVRARAGSDPKAECALTRLCFKITALPMNFNRSLTEV